MTDPAAPWLLTTDGPRLARVRVLWVLPPVDPAALRAVVADVRARVAAKKTPR
jgi:hypothetical protein